MTKPGLTFMLPVKYCLGHVRGRFWAIKRSSPCRITAIADIVGMIGHCNRGQLGHRSLQSRPVVTHALHTLWPHVTHCTPLDTCTATLGQTLQPSSAKLPRANWPHFGQSHLSKSRACLARSMVHGQRPAKLRRLLLVKAVKIHADWCRHRRLLPRPARLRRPRP